MYLSTLGAADAEAGKFPEAVTAQERALHLPEAQGNPGLARMLQGRLDLNRNGQPFHEM